MSHTSSQKYLDKASVIRVRDELRRVGSEAEIVSLVKTARTAEDAANSIGCTVGAIVKSLVFIGDGKVILALISGDKKCNPRVLSNIFGIDGP